MDKVNTGVVAQVMGPVVDVHFAEGQLPMLFPRIGIMFWPRFNRNRGAGQPETEGSDLID